MFLSRFEPAVNGYLMYYGTDLYYFNPKDMEEFIKEGKIVVNSKYPEKSMSAPLQFQIAISDVCNMRCFNCYNVNENDKVSTKRELNYETKKRLIDFLYEWGVLFIQWSGGEPLLSKDLKGLVEYASKKNFVQTLLTNGLKFYNKDIAEWAAQSFQRVQISFNAVDKFKEWTGVDKFLILKQGLLNISKYCHQHKTSLSITTTVNKISISELEKIAFWINKINPTHWRIGEEVPIGMAEKQSRHMDLLEKSYEIFLRLKKKYKKINWHHCFEVEKADSLFPIEWQSSPAGRTMLYMSATGKIYPFPYFKIPEFYLGKYPENNLKDIWFNSKVLKELRSVEYKDTGCEKCNNICVRWAREINYHFNKNLKEVPALFTNCYRKNS